jgi:hypothetical protein
MGITQAQILEINRNGSNSIDFQNEALSNQKDVKIDAGKSSHDMVKNQLRLKATGMKNSLKDSDDMYKTIMKLKKTGMLPQMLKRAGIKKNYLAESVLSILDPNTSVKSIQAFQEMEGAGSEPIASFGKTGIMLKNSYPTNGGLGSKKTKIIEERGADSDLLKKMASTKIKIATPFERKHPNIDFKKKIADEARKFLKAKKEKRINNG